MTNKKVVKIQLTEDQLENLSEKVAEKIIIIMKKNEDKKIKNKINQSAVERPGIPFKIS